MIKICEICGKTYDGHFNSKYCSDTCKKVKRRMNSEKYRRNHKEEYRDYQKRYHQEHKEKIRTYQKKYRLKNSNKVKVWNKTHKKKQKELKNPIEAFNYELETILNYEGTKNRCTADCFNCKRKDCIY